MNISEQSAYLNSVNTDKFGAIHLVSFPKSGNTWFRYLLAYSIWPELDKIDLALLPIGDNFTMNITDAVKAVEFLKPRKAIPMHYNTFDLIACDPTKFADGIKQFGAEGIVLECGETYELN